MKMNKELLIQVAKRTQRKVKQELPTKAFLTEKQINRRLSVGSYGRRLMEWMKEQQQERYQQLLQEGDLFPILVEVQVEASQTKDKMVDEMLNDPEIKAMDWLERSKVITLQSDLIDQQIMREIVLIPR
ncbi:MAG: TnpV protein [Hominilimicola sp.]